MKIECQINPLTTPISSAIFEYKKTKTFCVIKSITDSLMNKCSLEIKWSTNKPDNETNYYIEIIKSILNHVIKRELESYKTIELEFYFTNEENMLFCAINSVFLALCAANVPLKDCFYATSSFNLNEECFVVFKEIIIFKHGFGRISNEIEDEAMKNFEEIREQVNYEIKQKLCFLANE